MRSWWGRGRPPWVLLIKVSCPSGGGDDDDDDDDDGPERQEAQTSLLIGAEPGQEEKEKPESQTGTGSKDRNKRAGISK